ncbi:MAG TPA: DUF3574 domain-containing protein [Thermoanaerobaculia bacterium]|jgi:hypothetical protein
MRRTPIVLTLAILLTACAPLRASTTDERMDVVRERIARHRATTVADRLYCGMSVADGSTVTDAQVETFITEVVEPRFPDGFTIWRARGAWLGAREETVIIEIAHGGDAAASQRVAEIGAEYVRRFRQAAVLRMTLPAQIEFITASTTTESGH